MAAVAFAFEPVALHPPFFAGGAATQLFASEQVKPSGHAAFEQSLVHAPPSQRLDWQSAFAVHDAPSFASSGFGSPSGQGS